MQTTPKKCALAGALGFLLFSASSLQAQNLSEKTGVRFYEHHSSSMTGANFGEGADGSQSGYDLLKHRYISSFDISSFRAWPASSTVPADADMVEHNGIYGNGMGFGFTSGNSTIWSQMGPPYIRGNNQTLFMAAPAGFDYDAVTDMSAIKDAFISSMAAKSVQSVGDGQVYLAKLRDTETYVAIKITKVQNVPSNVSGQADAYFEFDYKYASQTSGIEEATAEVAAEVNVFPNPAQNQLHVQIAEGQEISRLRLVDALGRSVLEQTGAFASTALLEVSALDRGIYFLEVQTGNESRMVRVVLGQ